MNKHEQKKIKQKETETATHTDTEREGGKGRIMESAWKVIKKEDERYNLIELKHAIHSSKVIRLEHTK